jgi:integrase
LAAVIVVQTVSRETGSDLVRAYVARRQAVNASNATINRELAALKRALTLGCQGQKILHRPYIPMLREDNARQGFFEPAQVEAVRRHLPEALKPLLTFGAITGWRLSEVLHLTWAQVDFHASTVRLEPGTTKNRLGRMFSFTPALRALLEAQRARTETLGKQTDRIIPLVFHRGGRPIKDFRGAWKTACGAAGVPGRLFHDLRRTAVRNLERAGVPRSVAMLMTGHKTESVYRRYAIVSEADLQHAAGLLHSATGTATGTISGTVARIQGPTGT